MAADPKRFVDPFGLGDEGLDLPHRLRDADRVQIQMVGNSVGPKRAEVPDGGTVTWINVDVFDTDDERERRVAPPLVPPVASQARARRTRASTMPHAPAHPRPGRNRPRGWRSTRRSVT